MDYNKITSFSEKLSNLAKLEIQAKDLKYYEDWINRNTLLTNENFKSISKLMYGSIDDYRHILSSNFLEKEKTENYYEEIFSVIMEFYINSKKQYNSTFYPMRGFVEYVETKMEISVRNLKIESIIKSRVLSSYINMIDSIFINSIVDDIRWYKENKKLNGKSKETKYSNYVFDRFSNNSIECFFYKYQYLFKILVDRTAYFIENINTLFYRLDKDFHDLQSNFSIESDILTNIDFNAGDTHNKGKSVIILSFNDKKIVYKPKKYDTTTVINSIYAYCNSNYNTNFKLINILSRKNYSYENFISSKEVSTMSDIKKFYRNYGELLGLAYILKATDLHFENIIAHGEYPVVIDTETFFQQNIPLKFIDHANINIKYDYMNSVITTGLIPFKILTERSKDKREGIDISGLSVGGTKIPFKTLSIVNRGSEDIKYEYVTKNIHKSNNVPIFKGEIYSYINYKEDIKEGFYDFLKKIENNKEEFKKSLKELANDLVVRNVLRGTQRYCDLLMYSYHPECLKDIREREKTLENLFSYNFNNKEICVSEYYQLLLGDVPIFYNKINSKDLFSEDKYINNVYSSPIIDLVIENIDKLEEKNIKKQLLYIDFSFNTYKKYEIKDNVVRENSDISYDFLDSLLINTYNELEESMYMCEKSKTVNWLDITTRDFGDNITGLEDNMYDGLSSVYIFYVIYEYRFKINCSKIKNYIKNTIKSLSENSNKGYSVFYGNYSLIYPLLLDYKLNKNKGSLKYAEKLILDFYENLSENHDYDWIRGISSYIKLCYVVYDITKKDKYYTIYNNLLKGAIIKNVNSDNSFAHGIGSLYHVYSLDSKYNIYSSQINMKLVNNNSWCKGNIGIVLSCISSNKSKNDILGLLSTFMPEEFENDSLCHGNAGLLELIITLETSYGIFTYSDLKKAIISRMVNEYKENLYFRLQGRVYMKSKSIFVGYLGVVYQLFRILDRNIPNILLLNYN